MKLYPEQVLINQVTDVEKPPDIIAAGGLLSVAAS
jgi:hypothetical protein